MAMHEPNPLPDQIGYIHTKMSPVEVARHASEDARSVCLREYGSAPEVTVYGDPDFTFPYVVMNLSQHFIINHLKRSVWVVFLFQTDQIQKIS